MKWRRQRRCDVKSEQGEWGDVVSKTWLSICQKGGNVDVDETLICNFTKRMETTLSCQCVNPINPIKMWGQSNQDVHLLYRCCQKHSLFCSRRRQRQKSENKVGVANTRTSAVLLSCAVKASGNWRPPVDVVLTLTFPSSFGNFPSIVARLSSSVV